MNPEETRDNMKKYIKIIDMIKNIDFAIYNRNRCFRMCFSKKMIKEDVPQNYLRCEFDSMKI